MQHHLPPRPLRTFVQRNRSRLVIAARSRVVRRRAVRAIGRAWLRFMLQINVVSCRVERWDVIAVFAVVDEHGSFKNVEKRMLRTSKGRGNRRVLPFYYLETGELVNKVGTDEFVVVATGLRLRCV
jgi:hypothetical protein